MKKPNLSINTEIEEDKKVSSPVKTVSSPVKTRRNDVVI